MRSLLYKEWLGLRPFAILLAAIWILGAIMTLMLDYPDEISLWDSLFIESAGTSLFLFILAFLLSQGLLTREKQDGTLAFLDSLPLSRASVFWSKWLLALLLLLAFLLLLTLEALAYGALSQTSLSGPFPWRSLAVWLSLQSLCCLTALSVGLLLSYLRWISFLALAALFWAVWWISQIGLPAAEWINPFNLVAPPSDPSSPWLLPWRHIQIQAGFSTLFTLLALALFLVRDSALSRQLSRAAASWPGRAFLALSLLAIPIAWISFLAAASDSLVDLGGGDFSTTNEALTAEALEKLSGDHEILHHSTTHYLFSYRKHQAPLLDPLFPEADRVFETVATFLELPSPLQSTQIAVDLCHPLHDHFAALAFWKKIRMSLSENDSLPQHLAILGHETLHVLLNLVTSSRAEEDFTSIRWFHEGLATFVEYRFFRSPRETLLSNRSLALASTWGPIHFEELIDDELLGQKRDAMLAYAAGRLWCEALVDVYGDSSPARLVAAMTSSSLPRTSTPLGRWRLYGQMAGLDLERVHSRFHRRLNELSQEHAATTVAFSLPSSTSISRAGKSILLTPSLPSPPPGNLPRGAHLVCRIRPSRDAPLTLYRTARLGEDGTFTFPSSLFLKPTFEYNLGWHTGSWSREPVWSHWQPSSLPNP